MTLSHRKAPLVEFNLLKLGEYFTHSGECFQKLDEYRGELMTENFDKPTGEFRTFNDHEMVGEIGE